MAQQDDVPAEIHEIRDAPSGLHAFVVLYDMTLGPAFGGIRCRSYASESSAREDAIGLARQMTWKCAIADLPAGGGKGVIMADRLTDRPRAYQVLGDFVESLAGRFYTAGDLGTDAGDVRNMASRSRYVAREEDLGDLGDASAIGIVAAMDALAPEEGAGEASPPRTANVQGLGEIGAAVARRAVEAGFDTRVADLDAARAQSLVSRLGGPSERLPVAAKSSGNPSRAARVSSIEPDRVLDEPCTVFSPCAVGGVIDAPVASSIRTLAIVGGANRILTNDQAGQILFERGVRYAPDFVVNSGAVIRGARFMLGGAPATDEEIRRIGRRAADIWEEAVRTKTPPESVALRRAKARIG